jgi:cytochrome c-type biogenesis protein CcmF
MPLIGQLALALALIVAIYSIGANLLGIRRNSPDLLLSARHALWAMCAMVTVAVAALWTGLLTSDFSLEYVASYSSVTLPIQYKFAALWGGQQGSLLFWTWLLSIFTSIAIFQNRRRNPEITPWALIVLAGVAIFFLGMLNFVTRPFDLLATVPPDGSDLNPLLQNYWMAIHPPSLYTGYVSAAVPFAFACGALVTRKLDDGWIRTTRRWAIFSWFFLTLGNLFGARWAYEVLGWGGYWAWDPVENAAFMPWLVMTAYLHSVMIQERKDMLKVWNLALIGMAFMLTLFGTFLTRSGVISSVHSFTQSGLGPYFLTFLIVVVAAYTALLISRVRDLKSPAEFESYLSREAAFLGHGLPGDLGGGARGQDNRRAAVLRQSQRAARARPGLPDGRGAADCLAAHFSADADADLPGAADDGRRRGRGRIRDGPPAMVCADGAFAGGVRARHRRRRVPPRRERAAPSGA